MKRDAKQKHYDFLWLKVNILVVFFLCIAFFPPSKRVFGLTSKQTRTNGHLHSTRNVSWLSDLACAHISPTPVTLDVVATHSLTDWHWQNVSSQFLKCVICFTWWLLSFLMSFRINTLVSICWRCHHYYCHAFTNTSFYNVSAIFMECIFKLFQCVFVSLCACVCVCRANVSRFSYKCRCYGCRNFYCPVYLFCVISSCCKTDFK